MKTQQEMQILAHIQRDMRFLGVRFPAHAQVKQAIPLLFVCLVSLTSLCLAEEEHPSPRLPSTVSDTLKEDVQLLQEETVVTAMRYEQPISEAPSNIYVMTAEDIRRSGAIDVPTVLRRVPGMEVLQSTGADFNVSVRGNIQHLANKLLVLVDGRSIFLDAQGLVKWKAIPVTLPEIQRIEVLLGPASAVYGFNAFDGVVNIITKDPEEINGALFQFGGGEFGTLSSSAIVGGRIDRLGYRLSAGWDQTQQWSDRDALAFRSYKFNLQTEYRVTAESDIKLRGGLTEVNREDAPFSRVNRPNSEPSLAYASLSYEHPDWLVHAWWNHWSDSPNSKVQPFLSDFLQTTVRNGGSRHHLRSNSYNVLAQYSSEVFSTQMTAGVNYRYNTISSTLTNGFQQENRLGFYVQDEWRMTPRFATIAGFRYDLSSQIEPTFSPRVAILFHATDDQTFRLSYSVAFRPPTLIDRHFETTNLLIFPTPGGPFTASFASQGSSNVEPEQIRSIELGYQGWWWQHRLRVRANIFYNELSDLIAFQTTGTAPTDPVVTSNVGDTEVYGGETGAEVLFTPWLRGWTNVAYQIFHQTIPGEHRRAAPQWKINGGLRLDGPYGLSGEILAHYVGATRYALSDFFTSFPPLGASAPNSRVDSYTLLNLRGAYRFWDDRAEVAISVFNALNDRHREHPLGDTIGSRILGWLTIHLGR